MDVNGTHIWYYFICKREVWLITHQIAADQEDDNLEIGRFISETSYQRQKKEMLIGNIKVDRIRREGDTLVVGEVKNHPHMKKVPITNYCFILTHCEKWELRQKGSFYFQKKRK